MADQSDQGKKRFITEGDIASLLQRYDATTALKLLQEVAYFAGPKIDWNALVKKTSTGITNAREYQMLWRHLAYRDSLTPVEDDAQPLDDDSDLDCELEASPHVSNEASMEANAHVKVMAASYMPAESNIPDNSTVEAPLTINIPNVKSSQEPSESPWSSRGINITFPVSLQKAPSTEGLNGNGSASGSVASRKKRKKWSPGEDAELIAAVKRCGEGNWAHILRGEFKGERTASQLSQRWALIRKRCDTSNSAPNQSGLQRTEAQMAANHALSLAVGNRAPAKKLTVGVSPMAPSGSTAEVPAVGTSSSQAQPQPNVVQALPRTAASVPAVKYRVAAVKKAPNSTSRTDLMVTANSVAAAACMAGPSTTASVQAEPEKNAAEVVSKAEPGKPISATCMPRPSGGLSVPKTEPGKSVTPATTSTATAKAQAVAPPNTRHVANGNMNHVAAASSHFTKSAVINPRSEGPVVRTMHHASTASAFVPKTVSEKRVSAASVPAAPPVPSMPNVGKVAQTGPRKPECVQKEQTPKNGASTTVVSQQTKTTSTNSESNAEMQVAVSKSLDVLPKSMVVESKTTVSPVNRAENKATTVSPVNGAASRTNVLPVNGADGKSKAKDEVNNKDDGLSKLNNGSKGPEVVTVAKSGNGM
ncbi:PREDICTED: mucin-5AC isoform X1 [Tarenaya hassleriana]|uniref:mucin-5AC isoform X1 n=1 Tax=Tarenaya hassleriana TaxID=28532 RepID=UPI00053C4542|nr:PREDICTED: mucin-5AC isoform X1 [Tarenaya hassleriana]XP_010544062.1 PREDICTED: mucin-5AC isoform X1 [Tarenaya hassleriana]